MSEIVLTSTNADRIVIRVIRAESNNYNFKTEGNDIVLRNKNG